MLKYSFSALVVAACALAAPDASAAKGWHAVQTQAGGPQSRTVHLYYADHKLRMESDGDSNAMIIHLPTGKLTIIDGAKKIYTQATLQDLMKVREQMKAQMKARIASMPKEMQARFEQMMKEQEEAEKKPLKLDATGKKDKVGKHACKYFTWKGPDGTGEACLADGLPVDTKPFRKDALALISAMKKAGAGTSAAASLAELQLAEHGFPVKTTRKIELGPQSIEIVTTLDKIENTAVPSDKMTGPKGFKKISFADFNQMQMAPGVK